MLPQPSTWQVGQPKTLSHIATPPCLLAYSTSFYSFKELLSGDGLIFPVNFIVNWQVLNRGSFASGHRFRPT